jgi:hypothetical protein
MQDDDDYDDDDKRRGIFEIFVIEAREPTKNIILSRHTAGFWYLGLL